MSTEPSIGHESYQESQAADLELVPPAPAGIDHLPAFPGHEEMQGMASMAVTLAAALAVPEAMRNRPNDVFLVLLTGRELGIPPTTALRECHVIDGKVTISPKLKLALVRSSGVGRVWKDPKSNAESATWYGVRADDPETVHSSTVTIEDARRVKDKKGNVLADKNNWQSYPQRMLSWRAAGYLLDDVFSEVGTGLYSPDELGAMTDDDGNVIDVKTAEPLPGTDAPRGHRPPPPEPSASPEDLERISQRLQVITAVPGARSALLDLWNKRKEDGTPTLPKPEHLLARQVKVAEAMLASIERRMASGEWEDEKPEQPVGDGLDHEPEAEKPKQIVAPEDGQLVDVEQPPDGPPVSELTLTPVTYDADDPGRPF